MSSWRLKVRGQRQDRTSSSAVDVEAQRGTGDYSVLYFVFSYFYPVNNKYTNHLSAVIRHCSFDPMAAKSILTV